MSDTHKTSHGPGIAVLATTLLVLSSFTMVADPTTSSVNQSQPEDAAITVEEITNFVDTNRPTVPGFEYEFSEAFVGQDLLPGDSVRTFQDSEARIDIQIREFMRINRTTPNTIWRLGQFGVEEDTIVELAEGELFVFDGGDTEEMPDYFVVTPGGTAAVRGTWMSVSYNPVTGVVEVQCFRGICEVRNDLGAQTLTDEQMSVFTRFMSPTEPRPMEAQGISEFQELPEVQSGEVAIPPIWQVRTRTPRPTDTPEPEPTDTPEPEPTDTPEPEPTDTPEPEPTDTPEPEPTDTPEPEPTDTPEPEPTDTPEPEITATPEPTYTPEPEPTDTPEPEPTDTPEPEPTDTPEPEPTDTPEPEPTDTPEPEINLS